MFRTFDLLEGGVILVNLNHIISMTEGSHGMKSYSEVHLIDGGSFKTGVALNHIRAELDPKYIFPKG